MAPSNGYPTPGGNGNGAIERRPELSRPPRVARPRRQSYGGLAVLSGVVLLMSVLVTIGAAVSWIGDPVAGALLLLFLCATLAVAGAVTGIVLVPLGLSRGRRGWWVTGLVVGVISFAAMIAAIAWALRAEAVGGR